jgi:predicted transcriptional regulator
MMNEIDKLKEGLRNSFGSIKEDITSNTNNIQELMKNDRELKKKIQELKETIENLANNQSKDLLKEDMMTKIKRNRKEIVKAKILELVHTERYSIPEIKEILVDRDNYCSKATFYRYISNLKSMIENIQIGDKQVTVPIKIK